MKTGVKVLDTMTDEIVTVHPSTSVQECAILMKEKKLGSLIIQENGTLLGIITQEDIVFKVTAKRLKLATPVEKIMSKDLISVSPDLDVFDALELLKSNEVKQVPVVHDSKLVGILSVKDILQIQPELYDIIYQRGKMHHA